MTVQKHKHIIWKWWFDASLTYGGLLGSMITLPQAYGIWVNHNADGVSILYWLGYLCGNSIWLAYGIIHKEKPIIFSYLLSVPMAIIIVTGIILYK